MACGMSVALCVGKFFKSCENIPNSFPETPFVGTKRGLGAHRSSLVDIARNLGDLLVKRRVCI